MQIIVQVLVIVAVLATAIVPAFALAIAKDGTPFTREFWTS